MVSNLEKIMFSKKRLVECLILLAVSLATALAYNAFSGNGIPLVQKPLELHPGSDISLREAYQLFREGQTLFVDSRSSNAFNNGHIQGAIDVSVRDTMDKIKNILSIYPVDKPIVCYCNGSSCSSSRRLAGKIHQLGYRKVYVFYGGWKEWRTHNYPITSLKESGISQKDSDNNED
jgi:rhodanese-related sulfurtransferase